MPAAVDGGIYRLIEPGQLAVMGVSSAKPIRSECPQIQLSICHFSLQVKLYSPLDAFIYKTPTKCRQISHNLLGPYRLLPEPSSKY